MTTHTPDNTQYPVSSSVWGVSFCTRHITPPAAAGALFSPFLAALYKGKLYYKKNRKYTNERRRRHRRGGLFINSLARPTK